MKLIVEIEDEAYFKFMSGRPFGSDVLNAISYGLVKKSQILPKGHGRLIYAEDAENAVYLRDKELKENEPSYMRHRGDIDVLGVIKHINKIPTIIEADKEVEI